MKNRLNLDFGLSTNVERTEFVRQYLNQKEFIDSPPNESELKTIADYILWGRNPDTGKNDVQEKSVQIATKHGNWDNTHEAESLDALIESPTFNEAQLNKISTHFVKKAPKFSREKALEKTTDRLQQVFVDLFERIDATDFAINQYELMHEKRTEIREELLSKFSEADVQDYRSRVQDWTPYKYLKMRHQLADLRREQYTLFDAVETPIQRHQSVPIVTIAPTLDWDAEIIVRPLGLCNKQDRYNELVFRTRDRLNPKSYEEDELKQLSKWYWSRPQEDSRFGFDFRELEDVYALIMAQDELADGRDAETLEGNIGALMDTLKYYVSFTELTKLQQEILDMKMKKIRNQDIADYVNKKYGKNYTINYISTIFRQKIIPQINAAASEHLKMIELMYFPEEFKTCSCCGRTYLRSVTYFVRNKRSSDGLNSRCKYCDKISREEKKIIKNGK